MQYKTMMLQMLQARPELHEQLRSQRILLATLERYASQLRDNHLAWKDRLSQMNPDSGASQIASRALEIALQEMEDSLPPASPPDDSEPLSLEGAMAFIRSRMPPA